MELTITISVCCITVILTVSRQKGASVPTRRRTLQTDISDNMTDVDGTGSPGTHAPGPGDTGHGTDAPGPGGTGHGTDAPGPGDTGHGTDAPAGEAAWPWTHLAKTFVVIFPIYVLGYLEFSFSWVLIGLAVFVLWSRNTSCKVSRMSRALGFLQQQDRTSTHDLETDQLPSWIHFPDVERVEWVNKTVSQMWPYLCQFVEKLFRESVEPAVKGTSTHLNTFSFTKIELGDQPLRINGVKVYTENVDKRQIILDVQISFVANTEIEVDITRYYCKAGIRSVQLHGVLRVVLEPLLGEMPLVGAFSIFFLKKPLLDIGWTGLSNILDIPGLNGFSDSLIQDLIYSYLVLPHRITVPLVGDVELTQLRFPMPKGVLRIHFLEAQDLEGKDRFLGGLIRGKSDPYGVIQVANQMFHSRTIKECLNPKWNETYEAIVYEHSGQHLEIELFDEDPDKDDFLGSLLIDLNKLHKEQKVDEWFELEEVASGKLHLRLDWLRPLPHAGRLEQALRSTRTNLSLSSALLVVHLDSAQNLPVNSEQLNFNPDGSRHKGLLKSGRKVNNDMNPYVQLTVGQKTYDSKVRYRTCNPLWEEAFHFLVHDPRIQELQVEVKDDKHKCMLGSVQVALTALLAEEDMILTQEFDLNNSGPNSTLQLKMVLRILCLDKDSASIQPSAVQIRRSSQFAAPSSPHGQTHSPAPSPAPSPTPSPAQVSSSSSPGRPAAPQGKRGSEVSPVRLAEAGTSGLSSTQRQQSHRDSTPSLASDTSLPSAGLELQNRLSQLQNGGAPSSLGEVQLTIRHSCQRNKLIVVVHACRNLITLGRDGSDSYVRLYLLPDKSRSGRRKTSTIKKSLNPVYDQVFEFIVSVVELHRRTLDVAVKNGGGMLSKNRGLLGKVFVDLTNEDISRGCTQWYSLTADGGCGTM
ncbi:extended synaptotagmin-2 [Brachyhypopomus gauderio]|uniref:extended synaptotagmin-2 n=1 Tax=Brachyhypopomus gauderio TaxID=698409 RepID=UPI00404158A9